MLWYDTCMRGTWQTLWSLSLHTSVFFGTVLAFALRKRLSKPCICGHHFPRFLDRVSTAWLESYGATMKFGFTVVFTACIKEGSDILTAPTSGVLRPFKRYIATKGPNQVCNFYKNLKKLSWFVELLRQPLLKSLSPFMGIQMLPRRTWRAWNGRPKVWWRNLCCFTNLVLKLFKNIWVKEVYHFLTKSNMINIEVCISFTHLGINRTGKLEHGRLWTGAEPPQGSSTLTSIWATWQANHCLVRHRSACWNWWQSETRKTFLAQIRNRNRRRGYGSYTRNFRGWLLGFELFHKCFQYLPIHLLLAAKLER